MKKIALLLVLLLHSLAFAQLEVQKIETRTIEKFSFPLPNKYRFNITSSQGLRNSFKTNTGASTNGIWHNGWDIACPDKTPIYADKDGYILECFPGFFNGSKWKGHKTYGGLLILMHPDETISLYAHLSRVDVKEGDYVFRRQPIGLSGGVKNRRASGVSTGPHLHYAIYLNIDNLFLE